MRGWLHCCAQLSLSRGKESSKENKMRPNLISHSLYLLLILLLNPSIVHASLVETCSSVAASRPTIGFDFCVASLKEGPAGLSADPLGLAVLAVELSMANATIIKSRAEELMQLESTPPSMQDCLQVCSEVYSDAIDHLSDAINTLGSRLYREAITFLSASLDAPENCEDAFGDEGVSSPLAEEDGEYGMLADIALTITASLL